MVNVKIKFNVKVRVKAKARIRVKVKVRVRVKVKVRVRVKAKFERAWKVCLESSESIFRGPNVDGFVALDALAVECLKSE